MKYAKKIPDMVGKHYAVGRKLGAGSFGSIYAGRHKETNKDVAIKFESLKNKFPQLLYESRLYKILWKEGVTGISQVYWYGVEDNYNVMVLDRLGPSLEDLFDFSSRKFSLKTVLMLTDQLLSRMEYVHSRKYIHRDIKPENFLMGKRNRGHWVYIVDFGLAKKFIDDKTGKHIKHRKHKSLTGTARYTSINSHMGIEQSRRDDLESLGYMFMYFNRGALPWQGLRAANKEEKYEKISDKKVSTTTEQLCKGFPHEFAYYFNYVRDLKFDQKPDYSYLRKMFQDLFVQEGFEMDFIYDWNKLYKPLYARDNVEKYRSEILNREKAKNASVASSSANTSTAAVASSAPAPSSTTAQK